jgi:hypothetical protein
MTKRNRRLDDDDDHRLLRDGEFLSVPMMMRDGSPNGDLSPVQRAVVLDSAARGLHTNFDGRNNTRVRVVDGLGRPAGHRPGAVYLSADAGTTEHAVRVTADAMRHEAGDQYEHELTDAWRGSERHEIEVKPLTGDSRVDAYLSYQEDVQNRWRGAR